MATPPMMYETLDPQQAPSVGRKASNPALYGGLALLAAGIGGGFYAWKRGLLRRGTVGQAKVTLNPTPPYAAGTDRVVTAQIAFVNTSAIPAVFGVQGAIIEQSQGSVVGGHFFTSQQTVSQAVGEFASGGSASLAALSALDGNPAARVATVSVPAMAVGKATLYGPLVNPQPGMGRLAVFWIIPSPASNRLLITDTTGVVPPHTWSAQATMGIV